MRPAGAISTGANAATILTGHIDDAVSIALGTDSSVALANTAPAPPYPFVEYLLSGTYSEASTAREISYAQAGSEGALNVTALPATAANPSGSFAASFSNGANPPTTNACYYAPGTTQVNSSQIIIKHPDGTTTTINDGNNTVVEPRIAYDSYDDRLMILSSGACNQPAANGSTAFLDSYNVSTGTPSQTGTQVLFDAHTTPDSSWFTDSGSGAGGGIAASPTGYVAIAGALYGTTGNGGPVVQVFQAGTGTRATQGSPIPFYATTTSTGSTMAYCTSTCFVTSLRFLSATKLLIGFYSDKAAYQGFYLYNVGTLSTPNTTGAGQPCTPSTCFDPNGNAIGSSPTLVAFFQTVHHPLAAAYHYP